MTILQVASLGILIGFVVGAAAPKMTGSEQFAVVVGVTLVATFALVSIAMMVGQ